MNTEQASVRLSPAWVAALAGGILTGQKYSVNPVVLETSKDRLMSLLIVDFKLDLDDLKSKQPTTYTMEKVIMQGWTSMLIDIASGMHTKGNKDATLLLSLTVPLGDASQYWEHEEMAGIGRPPGMDEYVAENKAALIGEGEIDSPSPQPKDDIVENPDNYFDFGGLGERFGVN